jgi:Fe-S cluster assembly scaffold protein SufB
MIEISPGGGGTDTYLTEDVLMLDRTAKVDAIPGLEIKTNDVKASHSATVTRVTPEDLFYFSARGIPEHEARAMYIQGFLSDLAQKIGDERSRLLVLREVERKYERRQFQAQFSRGR